MTPDLKDMIDSVEEKNKTQSEFEQTIKFLKEETTRLNFTINEQKLLIQEQKEKIKNSVEVPEDMKILKDILMTQRQELKKKDKDINILEQKINELIEIADLNNNLGEHSIEKEELINAKKLIVQLTEENEMYQINETNAKKITAELMEENENLCSENESLKAQLRNLETNISKIEIEHQNLEEINLTNNEADNLKIEVKDLQDAIINLKQKLENAEVEFKDSERTNSGIIELKEMNLILEEENKKLKRNLETTDNTCNKLIDEIDGYLNEISDLNKEISVKSIKISALNEKFEILKSQNMELKTRLIEPDKNSELIIKSLKEEIEHLNNIILDLKGNKSSSSIDLNQNLKGIQCMPNYYQNNLFMRIFNILDENNKDILIDSIIEDLTKTEDSNIKRYIMTLLIDILSVLKDDRLYKALIELMHDEDWLIRLYLVKAINKIEIHELNERFKEQLELLLEDADLDVKEASEKILRSIHNSLNLN